MKTYFAVQTETTWYRTKIEANNEDEARKKYYKLKMKKSKQISRMSEEGEVVVGLWPNFKEKKRAKKSK